MSLKKRIRKIAKVQYKYDGFGATCSFFELPKNRGLKLYRNKKDAEKTYRLQLKAAGLGLAPPLQSGIVKLYRESWLAFGWGYVTSLAVLAGHRWEKEYDKSFYKAEQDLRNGLRDNGFYAQDMHVWNWGMFNGRPVCIDFSHFGGSRDA